MDSRTVKESCFVFLCIPDYIMMQYINITLDLDHYGVTHAFSLARGYRLMLGVWCEKEIIFSDQPILLNHAEHGQNAQANILRCFHRHDYCPGTIRLHGRCLYIPLLCMLNSILTD